MKPNSFTAYSFLSERLKTSGNLVTWGMCLWHGSRLKCIFFTCCLLVCSGTSFIGICFERFVCAVFKVQWVECLVLICVSVYPKLPDHRAGIKPRTVLLWGDSANHCRLFRVTDVCEQNILDSGPQPFSPGAPDSSSHICDWRGGADQLNPDHVIEIYFTTPPTQWNSWRNNAISMWTCLRLQ